MNALIIVANLLFEGRVDAAMRKYPGIDKKVWEIFTSKDPSGGRQKYIDWIAKSWSAQAQEDRPDPENVMKWVKDLHQRKADINALPGMAELERQATGETMGGRRGRILKKTNVILDNPDWLIVSPDSHEASQFYGGSTKWCVATSNATYWYKYKSRGELVYIKDRHRQQGDPEWKTAIYWSEGNHTDNPEAWEWFDTNDHRLTNYEKMEIWNSLPEETRSEITDLFEYSDPYSNESELQDEFVTYEWEEGDGRKNTVKAVSKMVFEKTGVDLGEAELMRQLNEVSGGKAERMLSWIHYTGFFDGNGAFDPDRWYVDYEYLDGYSKERGDREELDAIDEVIEMNMKSGKLMEILQSALDYWQFKELIRYWGEENLAERLQAAAVEMSKKRAHRPGETMPVNVYDFAGLMDLLRSTDPVLHAYLEKLSTVSESSATALVVRVLG